MDIQIQDLLTITEYTDDLTDDAHASVEYESKVKHTVTLRFGTEPVWERSVEAECYDQYALEDLRKEFTAEVAKLLAHTFTFVRAMEIAAAKAENERT